MFQWLFEVFKVADSSPIRILHSLISLSLSSSGFADASVAPIDFPIAPAAAVPKVLYFNQFFLSAYQGGRVVSRLDLQSSSPWFEYHSGHLLSVVRSQTLGHACE